MLNEFSLTPLFRFYRGIRPLATSSRTRSRGTRCQTEATGRTTVSHLHGEAATPSCVRTVLPSRRRPIRSLMACIYHNRREVAATQGAYSPRILSPGGSLLAGTLRSRRSELQCWCRVLDARDIRSSPMLPNASFEAVPIQETEECIRGHTEVSCSRSQSCQA